MLCLHKEFLHFNLHFGLNSSISAHWLNKRFWYCRKAKWQAMYLPRSSTFEQRYKTGTCYLLTAEEIFSQMSGACFFSKLNTSSKYWQTKVNEEISHVLALGTSLGRYCFKILPYRIHSTYNVFQWEITSIISDVCGRANPLYGIIVWGRTLAEHNECLNKVFLKICKSGPKLNNKKCQIGVKTIVFLRHIISSEGVQVNPAKTEPISKMPFSNSINELQ